MSYKVDKFSLFQVEDNPTAQEISTTYTELTGSKCEIKSINQSPKILYKYTFLASSIWFNSSNYNIHFLHVKLQKSNDNFSSNIVDVPNCLFNISSDTQATADALWKTCAPMFVLENFDSKYLRLVARSYSTSNKARLHTSNYYDGQVNPGNIYYNPSLIVMEL